MRRGFIPRSPWGGVSGAHASGDVVEIDPTSLAYRPGGPRRFAVEALLAVVTLGFYMPYWFFKRNQELCEIFHTLRLPGNAWWLSGGAAFAAWVRFTFGGFDLAASALSSLGIGVFIAGVYVLARNLETVADGLAVGPTVPPWLVAGGLGAGWIAVELGNLFPSPLVRGPAIVLLLNQPVIFYRLHRGLEAVHARLRELASEHLSAPTS
jgi:hypothetical protein